MLPLMMTASSRLFISQFCYFLCNLTVFICTWVDFVNFRSLSIAVLVMLIVMMVTASDFPAIPCTYSGHVVHMRVPLSQSGMVVSIWNLPKVGNALQLVSQLWAS